MASTALIADLLAFLATDNPSDEAFDKQALALFAHQFQHNGPFQRFCRQRGKTLRTVKSWRDIPAVPISAFKALTLSCIPASEAERTFMTSGTTQAEIKGKHHHPTLAVY
ncbi:MAG: long-chain fatty acid--CoA ligase, partial [Polaromonas sp.]|nr:long-chain fatty acid--CoA ligase [Polaromonas sp.]